MSYNNKIIRNLDLTAIAFPTDAITIAQMRRRQPGLLDSRDVHVGHLGANEAFCTHHFEIMLAEKAFADASGQPDPVPGTSRAEIEEALHESYTGFGLSSGQHWTSCAIAAIDEAARLQAKVGRDR